MRKFIIRNYQNRPVETDIDLDNIENVLLAKINIISGDEVLTVITKDGEELIWDSCPGGRIHGYDDGWYYVYSQKLGINFFADEEYLSMRNSYDRRYHTFDKDYVDDNCAKITDEVTEELA